MDLIIVGDKKDKKFQKLAFELSCLGLLPQFKNIDEIHINNLTYEKIKELMNLE